MVMKLYLVHCGFYDENVGGALYENHINVFVVANSFEEARVEAKKLDVVKEKKMHIDGMQEIEAVQGFDVLLRANEDLEGKSLLKTHKHRELAPPKPSNPV
jgi:hypothetical protein